MSSAEHTTICIVLPDDRILLQFRDEHAPTYPLSFTNWGGSVEEGETTLDCACRELMEELGLQVSPTELDFIGSSSFAGISRDIFLLRKNIQLSDLHLGEGAGFVCIPLSAIDSVPSNDILRHDLERLNDYLSSP
jgi:8-oxo-dGTP pyrophosphatase MutT (NUDIX family)